MYNFLLEMYLLFFLDTIELYYVHKFHTRVYILMALIRLQYIIYKNIIIPVANNGNGMEIPSATHQNIVNRQCIGIFIVVTGFN